MATRKNESQPISEDVVRWDEEEEELDEQELAYFRQLLLEERRNVKARAKRHISEAVVESDRSPDELDQASRLSDQAYLMRLADKERKLLRQIERALEKFGEDEYGFCEGTGEPISRKRLKLRPWTRYSIEYKEELEREKKRGRR
jgi:DnaK suppressor protein